MVLRMTEIEGLIDSPRKQNDLSILRPAELTADRCLCRDHIAKETGGVESAMECRLRNSTELQGIESVFGDGLPRCSSDMRRVARDQHLSDPRRQTAAECDSIIVADLIGGVMYMRHSHGRQRASAHQEMPSTGVVLMVVDGVVPPLPQQMAKLFRKSRRWARP